MSVDNATPAVVTADLVTKERRSSSLLVEEVDEADSVVVL